MDIRIPWEEYVRYVMTPPNNKFTIERMMSKRVCFHIDEDDFIGVGSHITRTDGNSVPVSGQYNQSPSNKVLRWVGSKVIEGVDTI